MKRVVRNPYAGVDWSSHARCKASMHAHTTQSDGTQSPAGVIDEHHAKRYDILALTDHDAIPGWPGTERGSTWPWTSYGRHPDDLGMLAVECNEFSLIDHVNGYFTGVWTEQELRNGTHDRFAQDLPWIIDQIGVRGGLAQINHPGRYDRDEAALREAMSSGAYWFVHDPRGAADHRHNDGGSGFWTAAPMIERIDVTPAAISIEATRYDTITWSTDDGVPLGDGEHGPMAHPTAQDDHEDGR